MTFNLRPYQDKILRSVLDAKTQGLNRVLFVMPTGTGKTHVFIECALRLRTPGRPVLVLAHRDELLGQAEDKFERIAPSLKRGREQGTQYADADCDVIFASLQTLINPNRKRLERMAELNPCVVIYDEGHHSPAAGSQRVLEWLGCYDGRTFLAGCTATPHRLDKLALTGPEKAVFEKVVDSFSFADAMRQKWLCPVRGYRIVTEVDLSGVPTKGGDFVPNLLSKKVDVEVRTAKVIQHWGEVAADRQTVVFCVSVEHAQHAAEAWRAAGYRAECVWGDMGDKARDASVGRFKAGETQIITNVAVLTEGFDYPELSCVVMMRPTKSRALYIQMAGRGTRTADGKRDLVILDVADNYKRHSLMATPVLVDLPAGLDLQGHSLLDALDKAEEFNRVAKKAKVEDFDSFCELVTRLEEIRETGEPSPLNNAVAMWTIPVGTRFGQLKVTGDKYTYKQNSYIPCLCSCGFDVNVPVKDLRQGKRVTCCANCDGSPIVGRVFGSLTVIGLSKSQPRRGDNGYRRFVICDCKCGSPSQVFPLSELMRGKRSRCFHQCRIQHIPKNDILASRYYTYRRKAKNQGVEFAWKSFLSFRDWAESSGGSKKFLSLERRDESGDFSPENCRWVQSKDRSDNE